MLQRLLVLHESRKPWQSSVRTGLSIGFGIHPLPMSSQDRPRSSRSARAARLSATPVPRAATAAPPMIQAATRRPEVGAESSEPYAFAGGARIGATGVASGGVRTAGRSGGVAATGGANGGVTTGAGTPPGAPVSGVSRP